MSRIFKVFGRALLLRCPMCGRGRLFRGWLSMYEKCDNCEYKFEREPGFFLGAIYVNYGLTSLVVAIAYPMLTLSGTLGRNTALFVVMSFAILFPIACFRHARSIWLGFDSIVDRQGQDHL